MTSLASLEIVGDKANIHDLSGTSPHAEFNEDQTQDSDNEFQNRALSLELIEEISVTVRENEETDEQSPVNSLSLIQAINFANHFNFTNFNLPEVLIEPDGSIAFEWESQNGDRCLILSFPGKSIIYCASIFSSDGEYHGKEVFNGESTPSMIDVFLNRVFEKIP